MSTAQLLRPQEKTGTWASIFPNEQVTEQQSALFVKKLLAVAISNVTYLRAIFPEHAFGDRCLEDLNLKILRDDSSCPGACQVIKWVKGCFDALDKKYLRMLVIGIYLDPDNPETVIESYTFKFSYSADGGIDIYRNNKKISSAYTAAETRKATIRLLRTIVVLTQTLKSLPDDVMMTMKLLYYDEVTPADYEPPGFKAAESDGFKFDEEPTNIKVGDVSTPFHTVKMRIKTDGKQFEMKEDPAEEEEVLEASQEISNNGLDNEVVDASNTAKETTAVSQEERQLAEEGEGIVQDVRVPEVSPAKPSPGIDKNSAEVMSLSSEVAADEYKVRCPCGCNEDDGLMIMCAVCKFWQHGVCFIITEEEDAPEEHICDVCATAVKMCTDPQLSDMTSIAVQATCLWRRALLACMDMNRVLAPHLARRLGIEVTVAQGLMNRLEKEKFIKNPGKGKKLGKLVDKSLVKTEGIKKYFQKNKTREPQELDKKKTIEEPHRIEVNVVDKNNYSKNEVEMLVEQTEGINLCGRRLRSKESLKSKEICTVTKEVESHRKRGKKRAFSKVDDANEFEVSNSQDMEDSRCVQARKKKASVVAKAIMV